MVNRGSRIWRTVWPAQNGDRKFGQMAFRRFFAKTQHRRARSPARDHSRGRQELEQELHALCIETCVEQTDAGQVFRRAGQGSSRMIALSANGLTPYV
jgi:hypothetical protein